MPGYEALAHELVDAYRQSAEGKGMQRHNKNGKQAFVDQPICTITRAVGPGFATGQAVKKILEAATMYERDEPDRAIFELHGAMVYLAAAAHRMRGG